MKNELKNKHDDVACLQTLEELKIENEMLKSSLEEANKAIAKFVEGEKNLNMLLSQQTPMLAKKGIGYNGESKYGTYGNHFVRAKHNSCNYYGRMGHFAHTCSVRKSMKGKGKGEYVWSPKIKLILLELTLMDPSLNGYKKLALHFCKHLSKRKIKGIWMAKTQVYEEHHFRVNN